MNFELRHPQPPAPLLPASQSCDLNGKGADAFILFVADTYSNVAYYQCVQQYFIDHKELKDKLDQKTINIRIPRSQVLPDNDNQLQHWARTTFVNGPGDSLQAYNQEMTGKPID